MAYVIFSDGNCKICGKHALFTCDSCKCFICNEHAKIIHVNGSTHEHRFCPACSKKKKIKTKVVSGTLDTL